MGAPDDPALRDELLALELSLAARDLVALPGGVEGTLDDGFVEFGASGRRWDRTTMIEALRVAMPADVVIDDFEAIRLADNVVLATYRIRPGSPEVAGPVSVRSSIWVRSGGRWRMRFHQGTPLPG